VAAELEAVGIRLPAALAATKVDEASPGAVDTLREAFPELEVVAVSVLDDASLDRLRDLLWRLTGLVRVYLRGDEDPVALPPPVTVDDIAHSIHHELAARCEGARVWGPSARFPGQRVGRTHELADGDSVEILG
jgi:ribosome-interacting GTPase 1